MADSEGMAMMSDYARAIGGHTEITSAPVKGTTVSLTVVMEPPHLIPLVPENGGEHQFFPI
jgi:nitrate/nitrite-specific signal transduction histidine kinase